MPSLSKEAALVHEALVARGLETPLRPPVHEMDNETRKSLIAGHMTEIMQLLNLDLADDSLMETPHRIAKMYVDEIFSGLDYANFPKITLIENKMKVDEMVTVRDITLTSTCEHHLLPSMAKRRWPISRKIRSSVCQKLTVLCSSLPSVRRYRNV